MKYVAIHLKFIMIWGIFIFASQIKAQSVQDLKRDHLQIDPDKRTESNVQRSSSVMRRMSNEERTIYKIKSGLYKEDLKINSKDLAKYELFLKNLNTGILKLLATSDCGKKSAKSKIQCQINNKEIRIFANGFSFSKQKYNTSSTADFSLTDNHLEAKTSEIQTIIVNLGNQSIDDLTLESRGMGYFKKFNPLSQLDQIRIQFESLSKGLNFEGFHYSKSVPVRLNDVYAIRSIAYSYQSNLTEKVFDTIVVCKIIRLDNSGDITLIWKELARKNSPVILRK